MNKTHNYPMGSVSSCTMRLQDLFEAFTSCLQDLNPKRYETFAKENEEAFAIEDYDDMTPEQEESLEYAVEELFIVLNEYAGPYFYFGAHPGDGADYGFWFEEESFNQAVADGEVFKTFELPDLTIQHDFECEYIAVVSDHGNITLYDLNGEEEVWSIV
jgi:hypothetical protein